MVSNLVIAASTPNALAGSPMPNYAGTSSISAYNNLVKSAYFSSIAKMYDQVRLDWVKVKVTPTQSVLLQGSKQAIFASAWDRNGLTNPERPPGFAEICSYSSAFQRAINLDATTWSATRKLFSSSVAEKSFWLPTSFVQSISGGKLDTGFNLSPGQSISVPWNPQLLIGVLVSATTYHNGIVQAIPENTQVWNFFIEFEWGLSFRGLRFDVPNDNLAVPAASVIRNKAAQALLATYDIDGEDAVRPRPTVDGVDTFLPSGSQLAIYRFYYAQQSSSNRVITLWEPFQRVTPDVTDSGKVVHFTNLLNDPKTDTGIFIVVAFAYTVDYFTEVTLSLVAVPIGKTYDLKIAKKQTHVWVSQLNVYLTASDVAQTYLYIGFEHRRGSDVIKQTRTMMRQTDSIEETVSFPDLSDIYVPRSEQSVINPHISIIPFANFLSDTPYNGSTVTVLRNSQ